MDQPHTYVVTVCVALPEGETRIDCEVRASDEWQAARIAFAATAGAQMIWDVRIVTSAKE